jgi:uncharacterized protein with FMN-binding domain
MAPMTTGSKTQTKRRGSGGKVANSLVALGAAVVLAVYAAGYQRTKAAADRMDVASERRAPAPVAARLEASRTTIGPALEAPGTTRRAADAARPVTDSPPAPKAVTEPAAKPTTDTSALKPSVAAPATELPAATPADAPGATTPATPVTSVPATPVTPAPVATPVPVPAETKPAEPPAPPQPQYKDGTFYGWGTSRHGDIQAAVVIEGGRIASAYVSQCLTRYSCSWIAHLPPQVVARQSADVDYVSGATQSTNAFYYAVLEALAKAR